MRWRTAGSSANRTICWMSALPRLVGGVRLPGDHQLHRALGVEQQRAQPLRVTEHEREPLVGRHAAREADGQHARVEDSLGPAAAPARRRRGPARTPAPGVAPHRPAGSAASRASPRAARRRPRTAPGPPAAAAAPAVMPAISRAVQVGPCTPLVTEPIGTSAASNPPTATRTSPARPRRAAAETPLERWASRRPMCAMLNMSVSGSRPSARTRSIAEPRQQVGGEVVLHQADREPVDARGHGGVRREHGAGADRRERLVDVEAGRRHELPHPLQAEEPGVALVGVEDLRRGVPGHRAVGAHRPHAADPDEDLLADAVLGVAAVEAVGDLAQVGVVVLDVGVEQQQRHAADRGHPHPRPQHAALGHGDVDEDRRALGVGEQVQREALRVERRVGLLLPAVEREGLPEVARAVEQPDRDQRHAEVGGGLEVVAREDAEPARVVRQHLGDAELHREVADARRQRAGSVCPWYQRGPVRYPRRSSATSRPAATKPSSAGELGQAAGETSPSRRDRVAARCSRHADSSTEANRSWVGPCHVHRRFVARSCSGARAAGSWARTEKRRSALTPREA